eukprot:1826142-Alexandrium_andersonii.AAC.1
MCVPRLPPGRASARGLAQSRSTIGVTPRPALRPSVGPESPCASRDCPPAKRRPGGWLNHEALSVRRHGLDHRP